ncbi:MAG TPA: SDR family NAD(P)-dependent oxidoreductase [Tepidisphaeraceae bacterium]|nr:SDR family NAD(P)-dependent oxidoreductase [Tepidisphaeraceae bacterium]
MELTTDWRRLHGDAFSGARALVTGGAGFIGSHLVEALVALGASVVVIDDLSAGHRENLALFPGAEFVQGSILDRAAVARAMAGVNYVFHQAAMASVPLSVERPRDFYDVNVTGTLNVLEAAASAKVRRVTFAASSSAYGDSEVLPKVESMPPQPLSPYASSKVAGEGLMRAWANCYGVDTAALRYFNIFGPRQGADSAYAAVIAAFAKAMLQGKRPLIFGDGGQSRDFTYVHNAVHANLLAARHETPLGGEVINVACGERVTLMDLARVMREALDRPDLTPVHHPARAGDVRHSLADLSHARNVLAYQPVVGFEAGLRATVNWYRAVV